MEATQTHYLRMTPKVYDPVFTAKYVSFEKMSLTDLSPDLRHSILLTLWCGKTLIC